MKRSDVFYNNGEGVGIKFDGTCGFRIGIATIGGKDYHTLRISPLKHKQEVGDFEEGNGIDDTAPFVDLSFIKPESVDVVIKVLQILKKQMEEYEE